MFLGGANHAPEWRTESFANVVRWWWRFLALSRYGGDERVATFWEAVVFGWPSKPFGEKRARFSLIQERVVETLPEKWGDLSFEGGRDNHGNWRPWTHSWSGIGYLTAQGFHEMDRVPRGRPRTGRAVRLPLRLSAFGIEIRVTELGSAQAFLERCRAVAKRGRDPIVNDAAEIEEGWTTARRTLVDAVALLGLLGGLGSRSRRGFGSLSIQRLEVEDGPHDSLAIASAPADIAGYTAILGQALGEGRFDGEPPYSALSTKTTISVVARAPDPVKLMNDLGWAFQIYRSWGQSDRQNPGQHLHQFVGGGRRAAIAAGDDKGDWYRPEFKEDHDTIHLRRGGDRSDDARDNRAVFGLPHNYGKMSGFSTEVAWNQGSNLGDGDNVRGRRASPLLFHIHELGEGRGYVGVLVLARSRFLPEGAHLRIQDAHEDADRRAHRTYAPMSELEDADWCHAKKFIEFVRHGPVGVSNPFVDARGTAIGVTSDRPLPFVSYSPVLKNV